MELLPPPPMEERSELVEADQEGDEPRSDSSDSRRARPNWPREQLVDDEGAP